jgi:hypothetical protein
VHVGLLGADQMPPGLDHFALDAGAELVFR